MRHGIAAIACWLIFSLLGVAASAAPEDPKGLIVTLSVGADIRLASIATVDRVAPSRTPFGASWSVSAVDREGVESWRREFPAPIAFHTTPGTAVEITIAVPIPADESRLVVRDVDGVEKWALDVDAALMSSATARGRELHDEVALAKADTLALHAKARPTQPDSPTLKPLAPTPTRGTIASDPNDRPYVITGMSGKGALALHRVTGTSLNNNAEIRVFDAVTGLFVVSVQTDWRSASFSFLLPTGRYTFEADSNRLRVQNLLFYRAPYVSAPILVDQDLTVPMLLTNEESGTIEIAAIMPCSIVNQSDLYRPPFIDFAEATITLADGTRISRYVVETFGQMTRSDPQPVNGGCEVTYFMNMSPGSYDISLGMPGWENVEWKAVELSNGTIKRLSHHFREWDRKLVWKGRFEDRLISSKPFYTSINIIAPNLKNFYYGSYDPTDRGNFEIAYRREWMIELVFSPANGGLYARQRFQFDGRDHPSVLLLDRIIDGNSIDDGLLRIHGNGDREHRYNILFLAEGYTSETEPFDDRNRNRLWDGYSWIDENADGIVNDHYAQIGYPTYSPALNTDNPFYANEAFDDINGDGYHNAGEASEFHDNARDFMLSLLGSDFWYEHEDAFNAYVLFEPSAQAGFDITLPDGRQSVVRDTRYDANLRLPRRTMELNRTLATQRALTALPDVDLVVVLVNQTTNPYARGNMARTQPGVMVWPSGLHRRWMNDMGPSHEMGHFVAALCDEYSEYEGVHPLHGAPTTECPNVGFKPDPSEVPWRGWLAPDSPRPNRSLDGMLGVFEGAHYYSGGAYRPSFESTMRNLHPFFHAPSRAALEEALHLRTGTRHSVDDGERCQRTPINAVHARHGC